MSFRNAPIICPICGNMLTQLDRRLACTNAHSFDLAREGYVNLLGSYKNSHTLGDDRSMVRARRAFLHGGYYTAISAAIHQVVADFLTHTAHDEPPWIADMGCGEGYYLHKLTQDLVGPIHSIGLDISKEAVRLAARQNKASAFVAANLNRQIPLANQSMHLLLNIFAPRNASEFARVLAPGGLLLLVVPTAAHLHEWRAALAEQGATPLPIAQAKQQRAETLFARDFAPYPIAQYGPEPEHVQNVCYTVELNQRDLRNLLEMTPNAWRISAEHQLRARSLTPMSTTVSVQILTFQRR